MSVERYRRIKRIHQSYTALKPSAPLTRFDLCHRLFDLPAGYGSDRGGPQRSNSSHLESRKLTEYHIPFDARDASPLTLATLVTRRKNIRIYKPV